MNCPNCGANNILGSTFCIKCGISLKEIQQPVTEVQPQVPVQEPVQVQPEVAVPVQPVMEQPQQPVQPVYNEQPMYNQAPVQQVQYQQPMYNQPVYPQQPMNPVVATFNYFMYALLFLLKPMKTFEDEKSKFDAKTTFIFLGIVTGIMTVVGLLISVISFGIEWGWDYLQYFEWWQAIVEIIVMLAVGICVVAGVYYLASLVVKKQLGFIKSVAITTSAALPLALGFLVVGPLFGLLWEPLAYVVAAATGIYSFLIFYELINNEVGLEKDKKVYFNLVCMMILACATYFTLVALFVNAL